MILRPTPKPYHKQVKTTQKDTMLLDAYTPTVYPDRDQHLYDSDEEV